MTEVNWQRDPQVEFQIDKCGFTLQYIHDFPVEKIDVEASLANQARLDVSGKGGIDEEHVIELATLMEKGNPFKPLVGRYIGNTDRVVLKGGNHRLKGFPLIDVTRCGMYIISGNSAYYEDVLTRTLNRLNGKNSSKQENLAHAVWLVQTYARSPQDVAEDCDLNADDITAALRKEERRARIESAGVQPTKYMEYQRILLCKLPNDKVLRRVASIMQEYKLGESAYQALVNELVKLHSESAQMNRIAEWLKRDTTQAQIKQLGITKARGSGKGLTRDINSRFFTALNTLHGYLTEYPTCGKLHLYNSDQQEAAIRVMREIVVKGREVFGNEAF